MESRPCFVVNFRSGGGAPGPRDSEPVDAEERMFVHSLGDIHDVPAGVGGLAVLGHNVLVGHQFADAGEILVLEDDATAEEVVDGGLAADGRPAVPQVDGQLDEAIVIEEIEVAGVVDAREEVDGKVFDLQFGGFHRPDGDACQAGKRQYNFS